MDSPEVKARLKLKKTISEATARRWMFRMGYRWRKSPSGQYVDGHERPDVVGYRQTVFLPAWSKVEARMKAWSRDGTEEILIPENEWPHDIDDGPRPFQRQYTIAHFQDESTFFANDRCEVGWVHEDEKAVPRPKGEGVSLMISDFVSAELGFLASPDRNDRCRVEFSAGVNNQGYFTNEHMKVQTCHAINICNKYYPQYKHVFVFDNATTHMK
jgi:hypothetical protein